MTRHLVGMLTPSSNTVLEPVTSAIVADVPGVSAHFARFPVTRIVAHYREAGLDCRVERHLRLSDNFAFSEVPPERIAGMVREVADDVDAVMIYCTSLNGARVAADLEPELGKPVIDSVALTLWHCLDRLGVDMSAAARWGRMFAT